MVTISPLRSKGDDVEESIIPRRPALGSHGHGELAGRFYRPRSNARRFAVGIGRCGLEGRWSRTIPRRRGVHQEQFAATMPAWIVPLLMGGVGLALRCDSAPGSQGQQARESPKA
ncbi:MAG: hypothetical protein ACYS7M_15750 [Planctomycetota bacterium]